MPFKKSMRVTIEHGHANDHEADYSSVAYWYQTEPHAPFEPFPKDPALLLPYVPGPALQIPGAIEGEALLGSARATAGAVEVQDMSPFDGDWSKSAQLWWHAPGAGAVLTVNLPAPADGEYDLAGYFTRAKDYARVQVLQGDAALGPEVNLYDPEVRPTGAVALGRVRLKAGANPLRIRVTGKDFRSTAYLVGIDAFVLKKVAP